MALPYTPIELYRGDSLMQKATIREPRVNPEDPPGDPMVLDPTGWSAQVRESPDSTTIIAEFEVITTEAADGILYLSLTATQSAACSSGSWDLQQDLGEDNVVTYMRGPFIVDPDVTRA